MSDSINNYKNDQDATFIEISDDEKNIELNEIKKISNEENEIEYSKKNSNNENLNNFKELLNSIDKKNSTNNIEINKESLNEKNLDEINIYSEEVIFTNIDLINDFSEEEYRNDIKISLDKVNCNIKELNNKIERVNNNTKEETVKNKENIKKLSREIFINENNINVDNKKRKKLSCKCCYINYEFNDNIIEVLNEIQFYEQPRLKKKIFINRYISLITNFEKKKKLVGDAYYILKILNQIFSIITPALLSIQHIGGTSSDYENPFYWSTWVLTLLVGIITNFMAMFSLDKNFYSISLTLELLKVEGWEYIELSGKYSSDSDDKYNHDRKFSLFCNEIEKIVKKNLKSEYMNNKKDSTNNSFEEKIFEEGSNKDKNYSSNELEAIEIMFRFYELKYLLNTSELTDIIKNNYNDLIKEYNGILDDFNNYLKIINKKNDKLNQKIINYINKAKLKCANEIINNENKKSDSKNFNKNILIHIHSIFKEYMGSLIIE